MKQERDTGTLHPLSSLRMLNCLIKLGLPLWSLPRPMGEALGSALLHQEFCPVPTGGLFARVFPLHSASRSTSEPETVPRTDAARSCLQETVACTHRVAMEGAGLRSRRGPDNLHGAQETLAANPSLCRKETDSPTS